MRKFLIATSNQGKFKEFTCELSDLQIDFIDLRAAKMVGVEAPEPYETTWKNAIHKARFYGNRARCVTIAEDTSLRVDFLKGMPGVEAKRFGATPEERNRKILKALKNAPTSRRRAVFETSICVYNPVNEQLCVFNGKAEGRIATKISNNAREGMGYDAIFFYPPLKKTFAEMSVSEKNNVSHRGKALLQLKIYLLRLFGFKQYLAPVAIIVKNGKMLMIKRRDSRPEFNNKWEFPGGGVEPGEEVAHCLSREVKEETGLVVKPLEQLPGIFSYVARERLGNYQVFLLIYICSIKSGGLCLSDAEAVDYGWFTYNEALKQDLMPLNKKCIQSTSNYKVIKKYII